MEHLGRLPSELDLGDEQVKELLAFHRIQQRAQNVCPECIEESRLREKTCFVCARKFTDKDGLVKERGKGGGMGGGNAAMLDLLRERHTPKLKDAPPEVQEEKLRKMREWAEANGVKIRE